MAAMPYGARALNYTGPERSADVDPDARLRKLLAVLHRRRKLMLCIVIGGAVAIVCLALLLTPRYTATAQIIVEGARAIPTDQKAAEPGPDQATIQTQVAALQAHDLLTSVLAQLASDAGFRALEQRGARTSLMLPQTGATTPDVETMQLHLRVFQESGSHVISVAYSSPSPDEAAMIVNKITGYYLTAGEHESRSASNQAVAALTQRIAELRAQSESLGAKVADYQLKHGMNDAYKTNVIDQKLGDLNHELAVAQTELAARQTRHADLLASRGPNGDWGMLLSGLDAQAMVNLHGQVVNVLAGRQDSILVPSRSGSGVEQFPSESLRSKLSQELEQALLKLSGDERVATARVAAIEGRLAAVQRASDDLELHDLVAAAASAHGRYERLLLRRNELLEQGDDVTAPARLLSWAAVPIRPSSLSPLLFIGPALVALLVIACWTALWRDRLDQTIRTSAEATSALGFPCAGFLPFAPGALIGVTVADTTGASTFTEGLRGIMVSLQLLALRQRKPQVILVTSSVAGEGKSTLARNLAVCAARTGAKVLLLGFEDGVEAEPCPGAIPNGGFDWRAGQGSGRSQAAAPLRSWPVQSRGEKFDLAARARARIEVTQVGSDRSIDYLPVLRETNDGASLLFSIEEMSQLLRRQREAYDLILIDGAAVLEKPEVRLLAAISDQILFAVRWRKTRHTEARAALALLQNSGASAKLRGSRISVALTQVEVGPDVLAMEAELGRAEGLTSRRLS